MLERLAYPRSRAFPRVLVSALWALYLLIFGLFHDRIGLDLAALAIFPIIGGGWYFGFSGGMLVAGLTILANLAVIELDGHFALLRMTDPGSWAGNLALLVTGAIIGRLGTVARERQDALIELRKLEKESQLQADFLASLGNITTAALEVNDLDSILKILVKRTAELFEADNCFFALWDEASQSPVPMIAYGSASAVYPSVRFEPGEPTLAASILEAGRPLAISDFANSPYSSEVSPKMTALLEGKSVLGLPLVTRDRKLGTLFLDYRRMRQFSREDIARGELAARQIALALTKVQLLEQTEQRVNELSVLHEIALASTQVEGEDELLERATEVIGRNLFPDNFGVLILDGKSGVLRPHPSYRFYASDKSNRRNGVTVSLGEGITGQVAQSGTPQRIGDVRRVENYLSVDSRTRSELCVPLKVKERVLGVINAESTKLNAFTAKDEELMVTLAGQMATAIEYLRTLEAERRWLNQLAHSNELISALSQVTAQIEKALRPSEVLRTLGEELDELGLSGLPAFYLREQNQMAFHYASLLPADLHQSEEGMEAGSLSYQIQAEEMEVLFGIENVLAPMVLPKPLSTIKIILGGLSQKLIRKTLRVAGVTAQTEIIHLPLIFEDRLLGMLWLWGKDLTATDLPVMSIFAKQFAITMENARLFEEVQNLALTDPLTGLYNRRGLFELGKIEFARALRHNRPFSGIMLDLDHFKHINDTYGHPIGDQVLREFARRCKSSVREIDFVGRYGGEEIVVLLPETNLNVSVEIGERLRTRISDTPMQVGGNLELNVTVSAGVAAHDENTPNLETLIARADQAMYVAKHKGRNRVATSK